MKCPQCGKEVKDPKKPFRPFCSDRCKLLDLGRWISGEYRIRALETDAEEVADPENLNDATEE